MYGRIFSCAEVASEKQRLDALEDAVEAAGRLSGIVGRPKASAAGFNYSAALKAKGGNWTIDDLNQYITNPRGVVPGTNMTFAGISRGSERADLLAYLNTLSDNPAPLPKAAEAPGAPKAQ